MTRVSLFPFPFCEKKLFPWSKKWNLRPKVKKLQFLKITRSIYSTSQEIRTIFETECFFKLIPVGYRSNT